ncbi:unnamed protein product [Aphis gossypii]|uniref:Uncharacterized protein n=1 Tax=Aphis gossypii TaxID=80765 RepID=A0A9P0JA20_APHGO|nr:unnamed protein product [Aphis gossypii]
MDGENTTDVDGGADDSRDVVTIPLLLEFNEPETTMEPLIVDNDLPETELEFRPQEEPAQEVFVAMLSADPPVANAISVRLGSGADDNPSSAVAAEDDSEAENMDRCGRRKSRRHRGRRSRSRCNRSRRSRSRRSRSRCSRRGRRCSARSGSDDSEMSIAVEMADERAARNSRGGRKASRGGCGRKAGKTAAGGRRGVAKTVRGGGADKKQTTRDARKSSKRGSRGRKTAGD